MKKTLAFLAIFASLIWIAVLSFPDDDLHLIFCPVGQGDAILIQKGQNQILIDGGPDEKVLSCLGRHLPFWDRTIELVILTHPQADHLTGLISVLEDYQVEHLVINNVANDSQRFWRFREVLLAEKAKIFNPQAGERIKLAGLDFEILWPEEKLGSSLVWQKQESREAILGASTSFGNLNDTSVVLHLNFGSFDALLSGDISSDVEKEFELGEIEVLKVAHHGSKYSTSTEFLNQVRPGLAVISVGKNSFGHPSEEVLKRLEDASVKTLRTDKEGEIEIVSDGKGWKI